MFWLEMWPRWESGIFWDVESVPMVRCPAEDVSYLLVKKIEGRACLCGIFATLMAPTDPKWRFFVIVCVCVIFIYSSI